MLLRSETLARSGSCPARHEETWPEIRAGLPESGQAFAAAKPAPFRRPQVNFTAPQSHLEGRGEQWQKIISF